MKRNLNKEVLTVGNVKISFKQFCGQCYKAQKRVESLDFYVIKNRKELRKNWNALIYNVSKNHIQEIEKNKSFSTKLTEKIVKAINHIMP